jgi:hypothetical protein
MTRRGCVVSVDADSMPHTVCGPKVPFAYFITAAMSYPKKPR